MSQMILSAKKTLDEELSLAQWASIQDPKKSLPVLYDCVDRTHKRVRSACWGDKVRLNACDALFKQAQAGISLAQDALDTINATVNLPHQPPARDGADWPQIILLILSAVLGLICFVRSAFIINILLGVAAVLCMLLALLRECRKILWQGMAINLLTKAARLLRWKWLGRQIEKLIRKCGETEAAAAVPQLTATVTVTMNTQDVYAACMDQMEIIDSNLPLFTTPDVSSDEKGALLSLVYTMIQEQYASEGIYPEHMPAEVLDYLKTNALQYVRAEMYPATVTTALQKYLQENNLTLVDYSPEHEQLFQTQTMDETFTIMPAILKNGHLLEYGAAGVQENK